MFKNSRGSRVARSSRGPNSKEWDGSSAGVGITTTTAGAWLIDPVQAIDDYESPTVIRLLIAATGRLVTSPATAYYSAIGIYVASGDEDDVTVPTLLWDPIGDEQSDWVYRLAAAVPTATAVGTLFSSGGNDISTDVRSKRKIPRGSGLLLVFGGLQPGGGTAGTMEWAVNARALIISG